MDTLRIADLKTPALLLDLDGMQANLRTMAAHFHNCKAKLRPHFKGHQVLSLAKQQVEAGAIGLTCARLEHAERLVQQDIWDVLVASEIAGAGMIRQFVDLARLAPVMLPVDSATVVRDLAARAGKHTHLLNLVVDLDVGLGRCGVGSPEAALGLVKLILQKGMTFRGLMGYGGSNRRPHGPERERAAHAMLKPILEAKSLIEAAGIPVEVISCGSTADYAVMSAVPEVTEIQTGAYLWMDTGHQPFAPEFRRTLSVLATVISKTEGDRVVVDAGLKALGLNPDFPEVKGTTALRVRALHAEHAILDLVDPAFPIDLGDKIEIWIQYLDGAISLHTSVRGIRNRRVVEEFVIER